MSLINEFNQMIKSAKLKAIQKVSLERELTTEEFTEFKSLASELMGVSV